MPSFVPVGNLWGSRIYRMIRRRQRSKTALRDIPVCYILRKSRWLVKHYLAELKPNGGSSMNDRMTRVETRVDEIYSLLLENNRPKRGK